MIDANYFKKERADEISSYDLVPLFSINGKYNYSFVYEEKEIKLDPIFKFNISKDELLKELNNNDVKIVKEGKFYKVYLKKRD